MKFHSSTISIPNFSGHTLILPSLSIGNVGQLALDLIITTFQFQKVGILESPHVLPVIGNDAYATSSDQLVGKLVTSLEIFQKEGCMITILQQRSPVIKSHIDGFCVDLVEWIKTSQFNQVFLIRSADSALRIDEQLQGSQFRFIYGSNEFKEKASKQFQWKALESNSIIYENLSRTESLIGRFIQECQKESNSVTIAILLIFCAEGFNTPEALLIAENIAKYFNLGTSSNPNVSSIEWKRPISWKFLEEGKNVDFLSMF